MIVSSDMVIWPGVAMYIMSSCVGESKAPPRLYQRYSILQRLYSVCMLQLVQRHSCHRVTANTSCYANMSDFSNKWERNFKISGIAIGLLPG